MATTYNYNAVIRSWSCVDPVNGVYVAKWYVMDQPTVGASTKFWHEGMQTGTPLSSAPADNVLIPMTLNGTTNATLTLALQAQCQSLAARLSAMQAVPVSVPIGTVVPVQVTY